MSPDAKGVVNVGLVGAGAWGRRFIAAINDHPDVRLTAVASRNPATPSLVDPACAVVGEWRELVVMEGIDGVIVATPPSTHVEIASAALEAGRPTLIEKPLAMDVAEAEALSLLSEKLVVPVLVDFIHLFNPAWPALKARLDDIGEVLHLNGVGGRIGPFRADTPPLWDWAPHDLALALDLAGELPEVVSARRTSAADTNDGYGEVVDIRLDFPGGLRADLTVGNLLRERTRTVTVTGRDGSLFYDDIGEKAVALRRPARDDVSYPVAATPPLASAVCAFADLTDGNADPFDTLRLGVETTRLIAAIAAALPVGISRAKWSNVEIDRVSSFG